MPKLQVKLGLAEGGSSSDDFIFPLAPEKYSRNYGATYAPSAVAQADWLTSGKGCPPAVWSRNNPERISLEALLVDEKQLKGSGRDDVEQEIAKLQGFRKRTQKTGEPPDLVLSWGKQTDRVRIEDMTIEPRFWTEAGERKQATVQLRLLVIKVGGR